MEVPSSSCRAAGGGAVWLDATTGNGVRHPENDGEDQTKPQHMRDESEAAEYEDEDDREDK